MKKLVVSLTMVAFAVALQAGEGKDCAKACAATAKAATCDKAKAATCDKAATAKAATCDKAVAAKAGSCASACAGKQARKVDVTSKGATLLAKR